MTPSSSRPGSPEPPRLRNLLFDLDGTLSDPAPGIVGCVRHALASLDRPAPDDLTWVIGPPLRESFATLLCTDDAVLIERAVALYRERFGTVGLFENRLYDGIPALLHAEVARRRRLFVATSKPHVYARRIVDHFGLAGYFTAVHGSELDGTRADKTDLVAHVLRTEKLGAAETAMVGDRRHDIVGAAANGVATIAVGYGYGSAAELGQAAPDWYCETVADLAALLDRLP